MRLVAAVLVCTSAIVWAPACAPAPVGGGGGELFVLVRHAEKVDDSEDPELSPEGHARAASLADLLADAGVQTIYTTDYKRTRDTAGPLAQRLGLEPKLYDGGALEELAATLRASGERALVVGHSNTTPKLAALLGAGGLGRIADDEYDRIYLIVPGEERAVASVLRHVPWSE